jgi:hypothetical protein
MARSGPNRSRVRVSDAWDLALTGADFDPDSDSDFDRQTEKRKANQ